MASKKGKVPPSPMLAQLYDMKSSKNQKYRMGSKFRPQQNEEGPNIQITCMKLTDASQNLKSESEITHMITMNEQNDDIKTAKMNIITI